MTPHKPTLKEEIEFYLLARLEQYRDNRWVREEIEKWLEELRNPPKPKSR